MEKKIEDKAWDKYNSKFTRSKITYILSTIDGGLGIEHYRYKGKAFEFAYTDIDKKYDLVDIKRSTRFEELGVDKNYAVLDFVILPFNLYIEELEK